MQTINYQQVIDNCLILGRKADLHKYLIFNRFRFTQKWTAVAASSELRFSSFPANRFVPHFSSFPADRESPESRVAKTASCELKRNICPLAKWGMEHLSAYKGDFATGPSELMRNAVQSDGLRHPPLAQCG